MVIRANTATRLLAVLAAWAAITTVSAATASCGPGGDDVLSTPAPVAAVAATVSATPAAEGALDAVDSADPDSQLTPAAPLPDPTPAATPSPTPTPFSAPAREDQDGEKSAAPRLDGSATPGPGPRQVLRENGVETRGWLTDFDRHSVPYEEILAGGPPRDGIPPIDNPSFVSLEEGDGFLAAREPVIAFETNGDARAYPLQILTWHEIVNDVVGGAPVAVTFCPLCNSAIVFDRRLDGVTYSFGTTGNLRNSDLIMWDRQTQSWWQQLTGEGIVGELTGKKLTFLPARIISWEDFKTANPDGQALSQDTGHHRDYGRNPYVGYDRIDSPPFRLFTTFDLDERLQPKERVVSATVGGVDVAFPFSVLAEERVVNYKAGGRDLVVFFKPGTASALDGYSIRDSRDVGASGLFDARLDGEALTFETRGETRGETSADDIVDRQSGSVWNIQGEAVSGPLAGRKLQSIPHTNTFWFAIGAFKPDSEIYRGSG